MKKLSITFLIFFTILMHVQGRDRLATADSLNLNLYTLILINNISMWVKSNGLISRSPYIVKGTVYPKNTASIVYTDGFLFGGFVQDGTTPSLRIEGSKFNSGMQPGRILTRGHAEPRNISKRTIWNIRKDWADTDLTDEARRIFNLPDTIYHYPTHPDSTSRTEIRDVTEKEINAVRKMYEESWNTWPWKKGAPFYDDNNNGVMDPGEKPGLLDADQVIWFVCNDLDKDISCSFLGSPPIGMELQVTIWAYNRKGGDLEKALNQTVFRRYRLIYKGTEETPDSAHIDSMFISLWSDCDIGYNWDDYVGCDTLLDLMFGYNKSTIDKKFTVYELPPPSAGYTLLQGPVIFTGNLKDEAISGSGIKHGYKNLNMTTFNYFSVLASGDIINSYENTIHWYFTMNGLLPYSNLPWTDAQYNPDLFPLSDDPAHNGLDVDGIILHEGDRRMQMHSGPFSMALGDTQDVVIAMVGGLGSDRLASVSVMKYWVKWVRFFYNNRLWTELAPFNQPEKKSNIPLQFELLHNYPNPFNAITRITCKIPVEDNVQIKIYNSLGRQITTLVNETLKSGYYTVIWDASGLPSGIYFCSVKTGQTVRTIKMVLLK